MEDLASIIAEKVAYSLSLEFNNSRVKLDDSLL
jgi:hypothetical protein